MIVTMLCVVLGACGERQHDRSRSDSLRIAVAANFYPVLKRLIADFEMQYQLDVELISGATGQLSEQIKRGLPVDVFLAADDIRPKYLEQQQLIVENSRQQYARGKLVLLSIQEKAMPENDIEQTLKNNKFDVIALANEQLAPYGRAAVEVLEYYQIQPTKLVTATNVSGVRLLLENGAGTGFVPLAMAIKMDASTGMVRDYWIVPNNAYSPIIQQMVLIKASKQPIQSKRFQQWLLSETIQQKIQQQGYQ